jgi:hypothetical protein
MFIHTKDKTEVEAKISDDGSLVICCPKCKTVWAGTLNVISKVRIKPASYEIYTTYGAGIPRVLKGYERTKINGIASYFQPIEKKSRQEIVLSARKAFPKAFRRW